MTTKINLHLLAQEIAKEYDRSDIECMLESAYENEDKCSAEIEDGLWPETLGDYDDWFFRITAVGDFGICDSRYNDYTYIGLRGISEIIVDEVTWDGENGKKEALTEAERKELATILEEIL